MLQKARGDYLHATRVLLCYYYFFLNLQVVKLSCAVMDR